MSCSSCGQLGHNKRTCQISQKQNLNHNETRKSDVKSHNNNEKQTEYLIDTVSTKYNCSSCGQPGHNSRTCEKQNVSFAHKCSSCGQSGHNSRTCGKQKELTIQHNCSFCGLPGHNAKTCGKLKGLSPNRTGNIGVSLSMKKADYSTDASGSSKLSTLDVEKKSPQMKSKTGINIKNEKHKQIDKEQSKSPKNLDAKPDTRTAKVAQAKDIKQHPVKTTVKVFCTGCNKYGHFEDTCFAKRKSDIVPQRHCGVCNEKDHDRRQCPLLEEERAKAKLPGPTWLNSDAQQRLKEGPTEKDGPGHIYMYKLVNPKTSEEAQIYKIGMSAELPERRIKVQSSRNGEAYQAIMTDKTPWHKLTEKVIHLHLKEVNKPRENGDGRTEWFLGTREYLTRVIKDVIKEVSLSDFSVL